jgi:hypothetical protein
MNQAVISSDAEGRREEPGRLEAREVLLSREEGSVPDGEAAPQARDIVAPRRFGSSSIRQGVTATPLVRAAART